MSAFARWILAHKFSVIGVWLLVTIVGLASASSATNALSGEFAVPGREGYDTNLRILRTHGVDTGFAPFLPVVTLPSGVTVHSSGVKAQLAQAFARISARTPGARVVSYASTGNRAFVSRDGRTTF